MAEFLIAGAGIAGFAAALALAQGGHKVRLAEQRAALGEIGAGLQVAPNATRVLDRLGLLAPVERVATESQAVRILRGRDGTELARVPLGAAVRARYGAPALVVHRADLHHVLAGAADSRPEISLSLGTAVSGIDADGAAATLTRPGEAVRLSVDGVVAADGLGGTRRRGARPIFSGKSAWRALVPQTTLPAWFGEPFTSLWLGERAHVVHYPLRGNSVVNVVVIVDETLGGDGDDVDPWAVPGDPEVLRHRLQDWSPALRTLVAQAPAWRRWPLYMGRPDAPWSRGRLTTVGDAAHPMLPFLAQGASQAFEDAAALADAVAAHTQDIPTAFDVYERARSARVRRVQDASRRQGRTYHLAGPASVARNLVLGALGPDRLLARMDWLYGPRPD